jgi:hypothetical protein
MPRLTAFLVSTALLLGASALPAQAEDAASFMQRFGGSWIGTGQVLFGAEPRPEFACQLNNDPSATKLTFGMSGQCHMGGLSAPIYAELRYNADTKQFYGDFMGGSQGAGADIVGTQSGEAVSLKLSRGTLQGRLSAEPVGNDQLKVVIYYRDVRTNTEMPVVAMGLTRKEVITGSITPQN